MGISSFEPQTDDVIAQECIARSNAFTRACQGKNITKVSRMLSSGSFEVLEKHVELVRETRSLYDLLVHTAAQAIGLNVLRPRCPGAVALPRFLVDCVLECELEFVSRRSNRFLRIEHGSASVGKLGNCKIIIYKLLSFMTSDEIQAWPALSRAFAFDICDTTEFAKLHYQNTFAICYTGRLTLSS